MKENLLIVALGVLIAIDLYNTYQWVMSIGHGFDWWALFNSAYATYLSFRVKDKLQSVYGFVPFIPFSRLLVR